MLPIYLSVILQYSLIILKPIFNSSIVSPNLFKYNVSTHGEANAHKIPAHYRSVVGQHILFVYSRLLLSAGSPAKAITTNGIVPHFRYALEDSTGRIYEGGSAKEVTVKQFPISKGMPGSMILKPGGLRELHWHAIAAEWAYVIKGHCRVTVIDPEGHSEIKDFGPGDVWYFPRGHGHSIQGLGNEECHFILTFDNGAFSEFSTFSITDWIAQTPVSVLAKNFHMKESDFSSFPKQEAYIASGQVPPPLSADPLPFSQSSGPLSHRYRLGSQKPLYFEGGTFSMVDQKLFPISSTMAGAILELKPKAMRELHWHPNSDEWQYYISGQARMTVFLSHGNAVTEEFKAGDVGYVPQGCGHYVENLSDEPCKMLAVFNTGNYQEIALSDWIASNPNGLLQTNFGVPKDIINKFPAKSSVMVSP